MSYCERSKVALLGAYVSGQDTNRDRHSPWVSVEHNVTLDGDNSPNTDTGHTGLGKGLRTWR